MPSLDDTLAALMARPRTTMRLGTSTASLSAVSVAGGTVSVDRWINAPSGAGEPVVLLMQDGAVVASVADADGRLAGGDTGWIALSSVGYSSPWADHNAQWKPYYRRVNGFVYFRGLVKPTSAVSSGSLIVTMPVGYRMANVNGQSNGGHFLVATGDYGNQYVLVYGSGRIDIGQAEGANVWVSLDTIRYPVD